MVSSPFDLFVSTRIVSLGIKCWSKHLSINLVSLGLFFVLLVTSRRMFARCVPRQAARRAVRSIRSSHQMPMRRRYSNSSVASTTSTPSPGAALGGLNTELDKLSPRFDITSSQIEILRSPSDFYETLKASSTTAFHNSANSFFSSLFRVVRLPVKRL